MFDGNRSYDALAVLQRRSKEALDRCGQARDLADIVSERRGELTGTF